MFQPSVPKAVPIHIFCFYHSFVCEAFCWLCSVSMNQREWHKGVVEWRRTFGSGLLWGDSRPAATSATCICMYSCVLAPLRNSEDKFVSWKSVGGKWDLTHLQKASFIKSTAVHLLSSCVSYRRGVSSAPEIAVQQVVMTITAVKRKHWACISNKQVKMTS